MSHLLSLSAMHRDGPGSLDVVFGADGTFAGAPTWDPPVFWLNQHIRWGWLRSQASFERLILPDLALDCRIPSVYDRLRRLIERVHGGIGWPSPEDLASLTLALAPKIAALGGTRV